MEPRLRSLIEALLALIPDPAQRAALRQAAPDADELGALADVPGLAENLRAAIATFASAKRVKRLAALEELLAKVDLDLDKPERAKKTTWYKELQVTLQQHLPTPAELALLASLKEQPKLDPRFVAACCTPAQLARMKQALLPAAALKRLSAAVLTADQKKRLQASKLPPDLVARIEASRPTAENVARLQAAADHVRAVEKGMLSAKKRARLEIKMPSQDDRREAAAARPDQTRWRKVEDLAAEILKEVTR